VKHYSAQLGAENCYVIDHGGDDRSTEGLAPVNVIRIPRSPFNAGKRSRFMERFCSGLLEWYDWVLHSDVDEIVVADPALYPSIPEFCESCGHDVVTTVGFNLVHSSEEAPYRPDQNVLAQRRWMYYLAPMCKPVLTRKPIEWVEGFHWAVNESPHFDDLYMFHLRFFDKDVGIRRLAKTRVQPWSDPEEAWWQRISDEAGLEMFNNLSQKPRKPGVEVKRSSAAVKNAIRQTLGKSTGKPDEEQPLMMNFEVDELWPVPARFQTAF
jgi:hypothetical protein